MRHNLWWVLAHGAGKSALGRVGHAPRPERVTPAIGLMDIDPGQNGCRGEPPTVGALDLDFDQRQDPLFGAGLPTVEKIIDKYPTDGKFLMQNP